MQNYGPACPPPAAPVTRRGDRAGRTGIGPGSEEHGPTPARLLLVEDDAPTRRALRLALLDEGYSVLEAGSGQEALRLLDEADVALLDVLLPDLDGFTVCRQIRAHSSLPVIMVTGRDESADVVAGLEAGADDYVTKPVVSTVLAARIGALLRRTRAVRDRVVHIGDLEVRADEGVIAKRGQEVHLTKTEFRLLLELLAAQGRVVTREELLERVWNYDYFGDTRLLDVHIRRLRTKIEDDPSEPRWVTTVRGVGYKLQS